jgi:type VI protein secretion system component VasF
VKNQRPIAAEEEHRVLQFRPRNPALTPGWRKDLSAQARQEEAREEPNDLSRYERPRDEPDDFRHRILANIAALAFTVALTAIGIWLAMSIQDLRRTQDCVLMGRRDCVRISTPAI